LNDIIYKHDFDILTSSLLVTLTLSQGHSKSNWVLPGLCQSVPQNFTKKFDR